MFNYSETTEQLRVIRDCLNGIKTNDKAIQNAIIDEYLFSNGIRGLRFSEGIQWIIDHLKQFLDFAADYDISGLKTAETREQAAARYASWPIHEQMAASYDVPKGFNFKPHVVDASDNYPFGFDYSRN